MAINDYALHTIEDTILKEPTPYSLARLLPWYSSSAASEVIAGTFSETMNVLSMSMQRLILEAEVSLANLNRLEERLSTLHELVSREDASISSAKSELLSDLWTKLGGNKRALRGFNEHLFLLKNMGGYRKRALVHVVAALQTLQAMSEDMEDLRERVAAPELTSGRIPVEVHIKSIKSGLERLREGRLKAKELEAEAVRKVLLIDSDEY
jgi:DNA repair ATPase RecN